MPIDLSLIKTVLDVLAANAGRANLTLELVGLDAEMILRKPLPVHQVQAAMHECVSHKWAIESDDDFGIPVFSITEAGEEKRHHF